ncbi:hypothetical protein [Blastococcus sp. TF02-8]|uniref:hypothetical protein n=1 Tax=Blastococcus sp. TF02-8 TaxID=2250574 RepID=UPI0011BDC032|nr:hypothetical protein [Blastococcus sp. TF02-8]
MKIERRPGDGVGQAFLRTHQSTVIDFGFVTRPDVRNVQTSASVGQNCTPSSSVVNTSHIMTEGSQHHSAAAASNTRGRISAETACQ